MIDNKVRECNEYIDQKIKSKRNSTTENKASFEERMMVGDKDFVEVVEILLQNDFSSMSKIKASLKKRLIENLQSQRMDSLEEDELDFADLDEVAGGVRENLEEIKKPKI